MRTDGRAGPADGAGIVWNMRHDTGMENLAELRVLHVADHAAFPELRVGRNLSRRIDQGAGNVRLGQAAVRFLGGQSFGPVPDDAVEVFDVLDPRRVVGEARVAGEV